MNMKVNMKNELEKLKASVMVDIDVHSENVDSDSNLDCEEINNLFESFLESKTSNLVEFILELAQTDITVHIYSDYDLVGEILLDK